jgi:hypothetical protein
MYPTDMSAKPVLILIAPLAALCQSSGSVTGQIVDQTESAVSGARVVVRAERTGREYATSANEAGYYTVASLPPADYVVSAEFAGFQKAASSSFKLDTASTARVNLTLVPLESKQTVEVRAEHALVETQTGMTGHTISEKEVNSLPLNGRNSLELALTVPGVGGEVGTDESGIFINVPVTGAGLSIAGGRTSSSAILADGASATSVGYGRSTVTFSPDSIQEFRVITSSFSAQYGVTGGGVVSTVSKSGTDKLRGTLFYFTRNPSLNARRFNSVLPPTLRRHEPGGNIGGPVVIPKIYNGRKRTFFFYSFEPKRWTDSTAVFTRLPTAEERQGDFRNTFVNTGAARPLLYQQVDCLPSPADCRNLVPLNRETNTTVYPLFSENDPDPTKRGYVIPRAFLDPVAQELLKTVPMPNMPYDSAGRNFFGERGVIGADNRWNLKIDHNLTSRNRLTGRYSHIPNVGDRFALDRKTLFFSNPTDRSITRQFYLADSFTVTPTIVSELRASYTFSDYSRFAPSELGRENFTRDKFGLPSQTSFGYPLFRSGFGDYGLSNGNAIGQFIEHQYQLSDDVTMTRGRHTITTGFDVRRLNLNAKSSGLQDACCGDYSFSAGLTGSGNANIPTGAGGLQFASFLLGVPSAVRLRGVVVPYYYRWKLGAAYVQDDIKVRNNFTLNLGLRWQYNSPRSEKFNRQATLDIDHPVPFNNANGSLGGYTFNYLYAGYGGRSIYLEPPHKRDFEPRFGFAWSPRLWSRTMVVRGGYGISHAPNTGRGRNPLPDFGASAGGSWNYTQWTGSGPQPLTQTARPTALVGIGRNVPVVTVDPGVLAIPSNGLLCAGCTPQDARVPGGNLVSFAKSNQVPYIQTWNLTMEFELPHRMVLSMSYLGQKGTHLYSPPFNANNPDPAQFESLLDAGGDPAQVVPDPFGRFDSAGNLRTTTLQNLMRPFPTLGDITVAGLTTGRSVYHAGTAGIERRFSKGLGFRFNYTWGKSIDTNSDAGGDQLEFYIWGIGRVQNPQDLKANRSVSMFDSRHRFNFTLTSELPFGKGRAFLSTSHPVVRNIVGGWSFNAVASLYGGYPFAPFLGEANGVPGASSGALRVFPDLVPGVPIVNPRWSKNVANDVPYFNPEAFARPPFGQLGNAPRTLDWGRNPWRPGLNTSVFREFRPFENRSRYLQLRGEFFNVLNHATFTTNPNSSPQIFSSAAVSRTGVSLAGPIPYLIGKTAADFPVGSREALIAQGYRQSFGVFDRNNNGQGRIIQVALKLYF